jgi:hypothetical protein
LSSEKKKAPDANAKLATKAFCIQRDGFFANTGQRAYRLTTVTLEDSKLVSVVNGPKLMRFEAEGQLEDALREERERTERL